MIIIIIIIILLLLLLLLLLSMMILIGLTCPLTIHFMILTKCDKCHYKDRQLLFLQSVMVRQVLQSATVLLQSATKHGVIRGN